MERTELPQSFAGPMERVQSWSHAFFEAMDRADQFLASCLSLSVVAKIPILFLLLAGVRLLYLVTFAPNLGGDIENYYEMIRRNQSNLIHAGGYPFFMRLLIWAPPLLLAWRCWHAARARWDSRTGRLLVAALLATALVFLHQRLHKWTSHPDRYGAFLIGFQYYLLALQHLLVVLTLWFAHATLKTVLGVWPAYVAVLAFGLHPDHIVHASLFFPEWLQSCFLIVSLCLTYRAFTAEDTHHKVGLYTLAGAAFTWCFVVKPSILVVGWVFPLLLLVDGLAWRWRLATVTVVLLIGALNYGSFLAFFHHPSTGTYAATHDKAWVLLGKLIMFAPGERFDPRAGIHTKRLLYLNAVLPNGGEHLLVAGPLWHVDQVPLEKRAPYREKYLHVLTADEATVDQLLRDGPARPWPDSYYPFCPTMSYLDVAQGDVLGTKVFLEHVWAYPGRYASSVWHGTASSLWNGPELQALPSGPTDLDALEYEPAALGFVRIQQASTPHEQVARSTRLYYWATLPYVWEPGLRLFAAWKSVGAVLYQHKLTLFTILAGLLIALGRCLLERRLDPRSACMLVLTAVVLTFIICSNMIFLYRWKEHLPMLLPISVLFVASLLEVVALVRAAVRRSPPPAATPQGG